MTTRIVPIAAHKQQSAIVVAWLVEQEHLLFTSLSEAMLYCASRAIAFVINKRTQVEYTVKADD